MIPKLHNYCNRHMLPTPDSSALAEPRLAPVNIGVSRPACNYRIRDLDLVSLYPELKKIARQRMSAERSDHTLQPTALVSELYLRLLRNPDFVWIDHGHFLIYASCAMRHLLIDYAKQRMAGKRKPGNYHRDLLSVSDFMSESDVNEILDIDEALTALAATDSRRAKVVELRFFGGLTFPEIGSALKITDRTAKRDWALAEEWLRCRLGGVSREPR